MGVMEIDMCVCVGVGEVNEDFLVKMIFEKRVGGRVKWVINKEVVYVNV